MKNKCTCPKWGNNRTLDGYCTIHDAQIASVDDNHMIDTMKNVYNKEQKGDRNKMKQKVKELEHNFKINSK